jgi:hypothetical protein
VIKSHVRRFLDEKKHNVTSAAEFVEATYSNEGIRLVQLANGAPLQLVKISLFNNLSFKSCGVRVHRSWKVG